MRKMISNNVIAVKNGKVGTMIGGGSFTASTQFSTEDSTQVLITGITKVGTNWETTGGPFDYNSLEEGTLYLKVVPELDYRRYLVRIGQDVWGVVNYSIPATFEGNVKVNQDGFKHGEKAEVGKIFKAFKLED